METSIKDDIQIMLAHSVLFDPETVAQVQKRLDTMPQDRMESLYAFLKGAEKKQEELLTILVQQDPSFPQKLEQMAHKFLTEYLKEEESQDEQIVKQDMQKLEDELQNY